MYVFGDKETKDLIDNGEFVSTSTDTNVETSKDDYKICNKSINIDVL
jgi:hypothetical protein